jgi:hypothetical protein
MTARSRHRTSRLEKFVLAVAGLVALAIWLPVSFDEDAGQHRRTARFVERNDPSLVVANLAARPLLDPSRRPTSQGLSKRSADATSAPSDVGERYILRGMAKAGSVDVVVLEDRADRRFVRLQRGQAVGGWFLSDVIDKVAVLMSASGEERRLTLVAPATP